MSAPGKLPGSAYEPADARPGVVAATAAALAAFIAVGIAVAFLLRHFEAARPAASSLAPVATFQNGVAQRTSVERTWMDYDPEVAAHLDEYAWVDRRAGTVRVPIERAIDMLCAEHAPRPAAKDGPKANE
jgi:predicted small secreted protein